MVLVGIALVGAVAGFVLLRRVEATVEEGAVRATA
jgi:hypothetical protein